MSACVPSKLPDGPCGIPVLGAALQWKGPETNLEWTKEFGAIYSVRIGPHQLVYLNTIQLVEEYMEKKGAALLGRPEGPAAIGQGLLFGQGESWRANRTAFTRALWGCHVEGPYEAVIHQEVDQLLPKLESHLGGPLEVDTLLLPALISRLATLLLGERLGDDCQEMQTVLGVMRNLEDVDLTSKSTQMFLKVKHFRRPLEAVSGRTIPDMFKMSGALQGVIQGWISRRREALKGQPAGQALLDKLLVSQEYVTRNEEFDKELIQSIMDLFNGGVTSSLSALEFTLLYLMHHPEVINKVKAEIDQVVAGGDPAAVSWANRHLFPYTQATLVEVLRLGSVTPSSLPHVATEDVIIEGENEEYVVSKGVFVVAGIYSLHRDPTFYQDPESFRPERHLNADQDKVVKPRSYRPYGVGERLCMGYNLVEVELFIFVTRLVAAFRVRAQDPLHPPPFDTQMRVVRRLKPFACVLERWPNT